MSESRRRKRNIKHLESSLQELDEFDEPKVELEQYCTPPHIAAIVLNTIDQVYDDFRNNIVADLGCGTGRLTIGSMLCEASFVYGFDCDSSALRTSLANIDGMFNEGSESDESESSACQARPNFDLIQADIASSNDFWNRFHRFFDTVIMNPPFGTKQNQGLDLTFLKRATELARGSVYSLHKTSTRNHITKKIQEWNLKGKPLAQIRYNLSNTYKFHRKKSVDIDVDLWRIDCRV